jgi:hypothetical protein
MVSTNNGLEKQSIIEAKVGGVDVLEPTART